MPEAVVGRTVWKKEDLEADTSRWLRFFTPDEVTHVESAIHDIEKNNLQLSEVDKSTFILPASLASTLASVRDELINGIGFIVLRGLPAQTYHSDESDIVGLLCLHQAMEGGHSQVVSTHHIYNILRKERPDVLRQLCLPHWFYDRKGETSKGEKEWMRTPGYYYYKGKLSMKWDSYYVGALRRFWEAGLLPKYTDAQQEAIKVMEEMCHRLSLEMTLPQGDVQFVTNTHNLHARSAYKDDNDVTKKRWLRRLSLATSEEEGGWPLPFADSKYAKRGSVQVNVTSESYPMEAE
ncbi:taurine catabolism dioxygenase TauD [Colletotrichum kahawae]|uniref:Taurine catabolism dioxygenase TauD n=1 Tax=Colletotrichum kahawae TaxID=34407 RepID=A0AAE0D493_COLKA|nr:taurine catabolism dioxygenase TauD [Colletotrichum kahawae]